MTNIYQKLGFLFAGTALSFAGLQCNLVQAAIKTQADTLPQGREAQLQMRQENLIAQVAFTTYYKTTTTNSNGYFSVAHGVPTNKVISGILVAVQHKNGNWHTLEYSHNVDNRFWWNSTNVQGTITSANFANRPVRIILFVR